MKGFVLSILLSVLMCGCGLFHKKADKLTSDIAGIIPYSDDDKGSYAMEARYSNWPDPDTMVVYIDGLRYNVSNMGDIYSLDGTLKYRIRNDYPIAQLYFAQRGTDFFVFYTDMAESGAGSFVKRISLETGEILWQTEVEGFAFSKPLVKGQFVYIGTIGFIGKLKLKNGSFDWCYSDLGKNGGLNHFRNIDFIDQRQVRFIAPHPFTTHGDTIVVNDITGEIIRMNTNK